MNESVSVPSFQRANTQPSRSTAEIVVDSLIGAGIDTLYCLPGVQNDPFLDAVWHRKEELKPIHSRHGRWNAIANRPGTKRDRQAGRPCSCDW